MTSPVVFEVVSPARHDRVQLVLRLLILAVLGMVGLSGGFVVLLLYLALPAAAAIVIDGRGAEDYQLRVAPELTKLLRWILSFSAYMTFLTDRFPTGEGSLVRFDVTPQGTPSVRSALLRLVTSLPEAFLIALVGLLGGLVVFLSVVSVLFAGHVPGGFVTFQRGFLRWQARLLAYHASLVDALPPVAIDGRVFDVPAGAEGG